jgi:pseudouridine synthase
LERLQVMMARAGLASRRKCEELIGAGKVKVNGRVIMRPGTKVDGTRDKVEVEGVLLNPAAVPRVYVLLNKPSGYVTTLADPQGRKQVTDLLTGLTVRVFPVGRLDYATEGLLLLTNDGELANRLAHPRYHVSKTYRALVKGFPGRAVVTALQRGVLLEDGKTVPAGIRLVRREGPNTLLEIRLYEGRNRQVRRMCAAVGHPVLVLKRIQLGFLKLGNLKVGEFRYLSPAEVMKLKCLVNIK